MPRELLQVGQFTIYIFGVMISLGFLAGIYISQREARRKGLDEELLYSFLLYAVLAGIIGARLAFVLIYDPGYYISNPAQILMISHGGLSIHGGIIGGVIAGIYFTRRHRLSFWQLADTLAPGLILGQAIGRIGCDVFGYAMARPYPWGVMADGKLLHPAQAYEFILNFALFLYLWRIRGKVKFEGQLFIHYFIIYNLIRGTIEFFRINPVIFGPFSVAHATALVLIGVALVVHRWLKQHGRPVSDRNAAVAGWRDTVAVGALAALSLLLYYNLY